MTFDGNCSVVREYALFKKGSFRAKYSQLLQFSTNSSELRVKVQTFRKTLIFDEEEKKKCNVTHLHLDRPQWHLLKVFAFASNMTEYGKKSSQFFSLILLYYKVLTDVTEMYF